MTNSRYAILCLTILIAALSQNTYASDKSLTIYTPYTFGTDAIPANTDRQVIKGNSSAARLGIGINIGYQKNSSFFLEKLVTQDSSKDIYISGFKFFPNDTAPSSANNTSAEDTSMPKSKEKDLTGTFTLASYILGAARITQDETTISPDKNRRRTGYNVALGTELFAMKYSHLHFVPLRFIITVGQNGTSAFVSSEIGLSLPGL